MVSVVKLDNLLSLERWAFNTKSTTFSTRASSSYIKLINLI